MVAYDYAQMADLYDLFCVFDRDVEFFRSRVAEAQGPVLELMAEESLLFDRCMAASNWTLPSHASILTGLYPRTHRLSGALPGLPGLRLTQRTQDMENTEAPKVGSCPSHLPGQGGQPGEA